MRASACVMRVEGRRALIQFEPRTSRFARGPVFEVGFELILSVSIRILGCCDDLLLPRGS